VDSSLVSVKDLIHKPARTSKYEQHEADDQSFKKHKAPGRPSMLLPMKRILSLIFVLAGILAFSAYQAKAKDNWTSVQSKNFTLVGNASESDIRKIAIKLEAFRETLSLMFPKIRLTTPTPTTVVIFKSDDSFRPFKPRYKGKIRDNVGGYFLPGPDMNYIVLTASKEFGNPYEVIFHEYEHFVLRNSLLKLPLWLDEGLAEFYSSFETTDNDQKITLGAPLARHVYYLRDHPIPSIKTLLAVDHKSPEYNESSKAGAFYAESWALVHYLMNGNQQKRQAQLIKFIDLLNSGVSPEDSFQKAFQSDFKTIEDELRNYVTRFTFPVLNGTFHQQLTFDKDLRSTALSEAEVQYYGGELLLNMRLLPEARAALEKSVQLDGKFSRGLVSLGVARLLEQRSDEAQKLFQAAIEADEQNYLGHYHYARTLTANHQYEKAIESYKKAIQLKPDLARLYEELGYAYLATGNEDEGIKTFEKGVSVDPRHGDFYYTLGYLHLTRRLGDFAANDAYGYMRAKGWRESHSQYMVLVWYFALRQSKRDPYANTVLLDSLSKVDPTDWPYPVLQFLNHTLTLDELLAKADDNDKLTEAHAYAGLSLSIDGDTKAALEHLQWVKDKGNQRFVEYPLALAELSRLERAAVDLK
jgi:tetratricopeptide (TPR) repeat protein